MHPKSIFFHVKAFLGCVGLRNFSNKNIYKVNQSKSKDSKMAAAKLGLLFTSFHSILTILKRQKET